MLDCIRRGVSAQHVGIDVDEAQAKASQATFIALAAILAFGTTVTVCVLFSGNPWTNVRVVYLVGIGGGITTVALVLLFEKKRQMPELIVDVDPADAAPVEDVVPLVPLTDEERAAFFSTYDWANFNGEDFRKNGILASSIWAICCYRLLSNNNVTLSEKIVLDPYMTPFLEGLKFTELYSAFKDAEAFWAVFKPTTQIGKTTPREMFIQQFTGEYYRARQFKHLWIGCATPLIDGAAYKKMFLAGDVQLECFWEIQEMGVPPTDKDLQRIWLKLLKEPYRLSRPKEANVHPHQKFWFFGMHVPGDYDFGSEERLKALTAHWEALIGDPVEVGEEKKAESQGQVDEAQLLRQFSYNADLSVLKERKIDPAKIWRAVWDTNKTDKKWDVLFIDPYTRNYLATQWFSTFHWLCGKARYERDFSPDTPIGNSTVREMFKAEYGRGYAYYRSIRDNRFLSLLMGPDPIMDVATFRTCKFLDAPGGILADCFWDVQQMGFIGSDDKDLIEAWLIFIRGSSLDEVQSALRKAPTEELRLFWSQGLTDAIKANWYTGQADFVRFWGDKKREVLK